MTLHAQDRRRLAHKQATFTKQQVHLARVARPRLRDTLGDAGQFLSRRGTREERAADALAIADYLRRVPEAPLYV